MITFLINQAVQVMSAPKKSTLSYAYISNGKKHESNYARKFPLATGSIITMDKGL